MGKPDPNQTAHFFVTQAQAILLGVFITGLMQLANHLSFYLILCCPFLFFLMLLEYYIYWRPKKDLTDEYTYKNFVSFIICCPVFFGVFFAVFHPTASKKFERVENCFISGQYSSTVEQREKYSILYANFDYEGQQYLGYACASNNYQAKTFLKLYPYQFYNKGDSIPQIISFLNLIQYCFLYCRCGKGSSSSDSDDRLLSSTIKNRKLAVGGDSGGGGGGGGGDGGGGSSSDSSGNFEILKLIINECTTAYKFSQVKLASWFCLEFYNIEEYTQQQSCYVHFFNNESRAKENGKNREGPKELANFPLISFKKTAYFPKVDIVCLILFAYYPFLLSFNQIFQYTSNSILEFFRKFKNNKNRSIKKYIDPSNSKSIKQNVIPQIQIHTLENEKKTQNSDKEKDHFNLENSLQPNSTQGIANSSPNMEAQINKLNSPSLKPLL